MVRVRWGLASARVRVRAGDWVWVWATFSLLSLSPTVTRSASVLHNLLLLRKNNIRSFFDSHSCMSDLKRCPRSIAPPRRPGLEQLLPVQNLSFCAVSTFLYFLYRSKLRKKTVTGILWRSDLHFLPRVLRIAAGLP